MKLLLWLVIGLAIIGLIKSWRRRVERADPPSDPERSEGAAAAPGLPQLMLRCARCGTHLPASEALQAGGLAYCCVAHRDAGPDPTARD